MLKYDDCGLRNVWLANGYQYVDVEGVGKCLEIDDIDGLHRAIGHHIVNYKKQLGAPDIRFLRAEIGMSQSRLGAFLGVDDQTVSLWERSKRRPSLSNQYMLKLLYLEHVDGKTAIAGQIKQWNDTDRHEVEKQVFEASRGKWRTAA